MYDIITIGSSIIDIFIHSSGFSIKSDKKEAYLCQLYGEKMEVDTFNVQTGGGGGNTAVGFARMGFKTAIVTETGKDTLSKVILDDFHTEFVATNLIIQEKKEQTGGAVILVGNDGERSILVHRGAASLLDPEDIPVTKLQQAEWIHLTSIGGNIATLKKIASSMGKKNKLSWNPGKQELELLNKRKLRIQDVPCDLLFVNQEEWESLTEVQEEVAWEVGEIIVTNAAEGGHIISNHGGSRIAFTAKKQQATDTTGAGDSFAVGYVSAKIKGHNTETAIEWGKANAASVVKHWGAKAGLLTGEGVGR